GAAPAAPPAPTQVATGRGGPVQAAFEKYALLGQFSWNCSQPPSKSNLYYVNTPIDGDRVQREQMSSLTDRDWTVILDRVVELRPNEIFVSGIRDGRPTDGIWHLEQGRMLQWDATVNGQRVIAAGKLVSNGRDLSWINRCGG